MTPEDRAVIVGMAQSPGRDPETLPADVLRHFGTDDEHELGLRPLRRQTPKTQAIHPADIARYGRGRG